ncbi:hypothetical protein AWB68_06815 [Caballeronia choica]|jgi:hypothetical protein|uniref:Uncharacterized protein n=1 Tax=Caballeronia choica TaxID=326476 RepID=A0A158KQ03_9BURK|nr:hypothetical protein [Caballeronia choica]SAL83197.1 hypothetical protein AWB68_06815 [Caballeronia choica]
MSPSAYLWIAFGGAFALCAAEALFVWHASRNAARELAVAARTHGARTVSLRLVARSLTDREP